MGTRKLSAESMIVHLAQLSELVSMARKLA
jgi:hypothetical protein